MRKTPLKMKRTTKRAVVEVGEREAQDWKVQREIAPVIKKAPREDRRRSCRQQVSNWV
jgi:hypothetical protein